MATRLKAKAQVYNVTSQDDAISQIKLIGDLERQKTRMTADADDKINEIKQNLGHGIEPLTTEINARFEAVQAYAESNRDALTANGKRKTVEYTTGTIGWRQRPPSVSVRAADAVMETLRKLGLQRFIRSKEEINKEAILAEPEAARGIAGLTINTGVEGFYIEPADSTGTAEAKAA